MSFVALAAFALTTTAYPDALDHLKAGSVVPQVGLILDRSCSMGWGAAPSICLDYIARYRGGNVSLNKKDQMKAALVGCRSPTDGIIDQWADRINFAVYEFGSGTTLRVPFDSTAAELEAGILQVPSTGGTHMSAGLKAMGSYFNNYFTNARTKSCRPNFMVMLSDGNPNGGSSTFNFECTSPTESRYVPSNRPWEGADYLFEHPDLLCSVDGDQNIRTYTIGFGAPGDFSPSNLQQIADEGGGEYYYASDAAQLNVAFESVINSIVAKSALFFAPISIEQGSLYAENFAYVAAFRPETVGPWTGTVKKHCVLPPRTASGGYDSSEDRCLFVSDDGETLLTNDTPLDLWTGSRSLAADSGGAGSVYFDTLGTTPGGPPAANPYDRRNLISWRHDAADYAAVKPGSWSRADALTNGCDHERLMSFLHGYTADADCATGAPMAARKWVLGDAVHSSPILLRYGECHDDAGQPQANTCFLAVGMNDGMMHFFDSADGRETTAMIPADLWSGVRARSRIGDILDQPNATHTHLYYVDGGARLLHVDADGDGIIDPTEEAELVFGLGRGGQAYYAVKVAKLPDGRITVANNPIRTIGRSPGTSYAHLSDTFAPPWLGLADVNSKKSAVAVFPSGHLGDLDLPVGPNPPPFVLPPSFDVSLAQSVNCVGANGFARHNGQTEGWCKAAHIQGCNGGNNPCYDGAGVPLDLSSGPITYSDGIRKPAAIRVQFFKFDIDPNDVLVIEDTAGTEVGRYTGSQLANAWSPWVYDEALVIRIISDGRDTRNQGFWMDYIEWVPGPPVAAAAGQAVVAGAGVRPDIVLGRDHKPSVFVVDVAGFNGAVPRPFAEQPDDSALQLRFTNDCEGMAVGRCFDAADFPDLAHMICPVSAEVSAYTEAGSARALYWGDECGQIFKGWTEDRGKTWQARRLINLNRGQKSVDTNHRKIMRRLDLVLSTCTGEPTIGVYFGTGDVQTPAGLNQLLDRTATNGRDIVGVVFDQSTLPADLTEANLYDLANGQQSALQMTLGGYHGWMLSLRPDERMLRDPLVFDGVAYFKTFEATSAAPECGGAAGTDRVYAVKSCSGRAANDLNGDGAYSDAEREVWEGDTGIGGNLFFFAPEDGRVLVSHADVTKKQKAALNKRGRARPRVYMWRTR